VCAVRQRAKYYLWNKTSDFGTGFVQNMRYSDSGLFLADKLQGSGCYYSRVLDSGESKKHWHRAELQAVWYPNTSVKITFYSSDRAELMCDDKMRPIEAILADETISPEEKNVIFSVCTSQTYYNRKDLMLTKVQGRYLWFCIQIQTGDSEAPYVTQLKLWLDKFDWLTYLPEVYQEDAEGADFTARFLGIFQNLYEEMNQRITQLPAHYDISHADRAFLEWLSEWIGLENSAIWSNEQLRELLRRAADLFRRTGTPGMLSDMVELYTGVRPILLENYLASDAQSAIQALQNQNYPRDPFGFTVLLPGSAVKSEAEHKALLQILSQYKPAHMRMQLIFIDPAWLNGSTPDQTQTICLDGRSSLMQRR